MFEIPHYASEVYTKSDELCNQREHVLLVVRDYNRYARINYIFIILLIFYILYLWMLESINYLTGLYINGIHCSLIACLLVVLICSRTE